MTGRPSAPPTPPPAIGPMSGYELRVIGERLYGTRGWQKGLGQALDLDVSTVRRYVDMERVPTVVAAALRHLVDLPREPDKARHAGGAAGGSSPVRPSGGRR